MRIGKTQSSIHSNIELVKLAIDAALEKSNKRLRFARKIYKGDDLKQFEKIYNLSKDLRYYADAIRRGGILTLGGVSYISQSVGAARFIQSMDRWFQEIDRFMEDSATEGKTDPQAHYQTYFYKGDRAVSPKQVMFPKERGPRYSIYFQLGYLYENGQMEEGYKAKIGLDQQNGIILFQKAFEITNADQNYVVSTLQDEMAKMLVKSGVMTANPTIIQVLLWHLLGG